MKLYDVNSNSFDPLKCDIFGMVGQLGASAMNNITNAVITDKTNEANAAIQQGINSTNTQIAQETNAINAANVAATNAANVQMNRENNETQIALADKAYERSTAANQIAELIKAGYSPQQAKSIVAGTGAQAAMPMPATTAATNQAATAQPWTDEAAFRQPWSPNFDGLSAMGQQLTADLQREDGGTIGQLMYNEVYNDLEALPNYDPAQIQSIDHFVRLANEKDKDGNFIHPEWHDYVNGDKFKKLLRSRLGRKAFNADHSESIARANQLISLHRDGVAFDAEKLSFYEQNLKMQDYEMVRGLMNDVTIKELRTQLDLWDLKPEHNREYLFARMENLLATESNQKLVAMALNLKYNAEYEALKDHPDMLLFTSIYKMFDDCGLTKTEIGSIFAYLEASGIHVAEDVKTIFAKIGLNDDSVINAVTSAADNLNGLVDSIEESALPTLNKIKEFNDLSPEDRKKRIKSYILGR